VKNVGIGAILSIIRARNEKGSFEGLYDFLEKVDAGVINKRTVESLIKCGAFDGFGVFRSRMIAVYEKLLDSIQDRRKSNVEGQISFFDNMDANDTAIGNIYPEIDEYPQRVLLAMEKEMMGLYISGHPLEEYESELKERVSMTTAELLRDTEAEEGDNLELDGKKAIIGGIIVSVKQKSTKTNNLMAFVELEDLFGTVEVIVFPKIYEKCKSLLVQDDIVLVEGRISQKEEEDAKIICDSVRPLNKNAGKKLYVKINTDLEPDILERVKQVLAAYKGIQPVYVVNGASEVKGKNRVMVADSNIWVDINDDLIDDLKQVVGDGCVAVK
jgi:DNA polymerase-3 subunit alpha